MPQGPPAPARPEGRPSLPTLPEHLERIRGFRDGIAGTDIEIVATVACNDDINIGVQVVEETMLANPDLDGWFFVGRPTLEELRHDLREIMQTRKDTATRPTTRLK